jgi:hypothetical protein
VEHLYRRPADTAQVLLVECDDWYLSCQQIAIKKVTLRSQANKPVGLDHDIVCLLMNFFTCVENVCMDRMREQVDAFRFRLVPKDACERIAVVAGSLVFKRTQYDLVDYDADLGRKVQEMEGLLFVRHLQQCVLETLRQKN